MQKQIPKQYIIVDACFTSLATIRGNLSIRHPKNLNHIHAYRKNPLLVILMLGNNFMMTKMFFNEVTINDIGTIAHDFKNSNENCVVGAFDKS